MSTRLTRGFFARAPDVVAYELVGCVMVVSRAKRRLRARIVETEAYGGQTDPASHAYRGPTPRTAIMFGPAGFIYVYRSYGIHWCMNVVTGKADTASAVLLRGAELVDNDDTLFEGPNMHGPGLLTRALDVTGADNGQDACHLPPDRFSFDSPPTRSGIHVGRSKRIGISKAQDRLWRFFEE
ncbi:MAG: DNA-3-methyladenine glycosylase [Acidimicrobiales bacterium]